MGAGEEKRILDSTVVEGVMKVREVGRVLDNRYKQSVDEYNDTSLMSRSTLYCIM